MKKNCEFKKELMKDICDFYGYDLKIEENFIETISDCKEYVFNYNNIDDTLIDWLDTLMDTDFECGSDCKSWTKEISFIKKLKVNNKFSGDTSNVDKNITYGELPKEIKEYYSVLLSEMEEKANKTHKLSKKLRTSRFSTKIYIPIELELDKSKSSINRVSIANEEYIERLILKGDYSEIEKSEMNRYCKTGELEELFLRPVDLSIEKVLINVPVVVRVFSNRFEICNINNPMKFFYN